MKSKIFIATITYAVWFIGSLIFIATRPIFSDVGHLDNGCYQTDALLLYVQCNGFYGAELIMDLVNVPYVIIQLVVSIGGIIGAAILLLPVLYIPWYLFKKHKNV